MRIREYWALARPERRRAGDSRIQNKGVLRGFRERKRLEAKGRNLIYRIRVAEMMEKHNISEADAKAVLAGNKKVEKRKVELRNGK